MRQVHPESRKKVEPSGRSFTPESWALAKRKLLVAAGLFAIFGLLSAGCAVFASKAEYRLVEQMRSETDPVLRADAYGSWREQYSTKGRLSGQVDKLRLAIDEGYWRYLSERGLKQADVDDYLRRFPDGVHVADARRRADQLRYFAQKAAEREEARRRAEEEERRRAEEENERRRAKVRSGLERWLRVALELPRWGTSIEALAALDEDFRELWSGPPEPVCVENTCRKTIEAFYYFAQPGGTRIDRSLSLVYQIDLRDGHIYRLTAYYTGRGFVDWLEMGSDHPILEETTEDRETARDAMTALVQGVVTSRFPDAVEQDSQEPGVLLSMTHDDLEITLREFPPDFSAGRVDGVQITYHGDLTASEPEAEPCD